MTYLLTSRTNRSSSQSRAPERERSPRRVDTSAGVHANLARRSCRTGGRIAVDMTTWFTADLHFGHANIIDYCGRPFADSTAMNEALIQRWNAHIQPDDTVWVLGDVALGRIDESLRLVGRLNGRKLLLAGNHDRCWDGHGRRAARWTERYVDAGFGSVLQGEVSMTIGDQEVVACHFPYRGDSHEQDRYADRRPADRGAWLLHGHVHGRWRQRGRMVNVGVDAWGCAPIDETTLLGIAAGPNASLGNVIDGID